MVAAWHQLFLRCVIDQKAEERRFSIKCAAGNDRAMAIGLGTGTCTVSHSWQHALDMTISGEMIAQHPQI